jgi:hypothetical protein
MLQNARARGGASDRRRAVVPQPPDGPHTVVPRPRRGARRDAVPKRPAGEAVRPPHRTSGTRRKPAYSSACALLADLVAFAFAAAPAGFCSGLCSALAPALGAAFAAGFLTAPTFSFGAPSITGVDSAGA